MANNRSSKPIFVENAEIRQMAVTVNVMSVNKKQMTLSVFRQLPCVNFIISESGYLDEDFLLWGIVRYSFDNINVWAVGSCDGELYRSSINYQRYRGTISTNNEAIKGLAKILDGLDEWEIMATKFDSDYHGSCIGNYDSSYHDSCIDNVYYVNNKYLKFSEYYRSSDRNRYLYEARSYLRNEITELRAMNVRKSRALLSLDQLMKLPQLFIAV